MKKVMSPWEDHREVNARHCVAATRERLTMGAKFLRPCSRARDSQFFTPRRCLSNAPCFKQSSTKGNICSALEGEERLEHAVRGCQISGVLIQPAASIALSAAGIGP